MPGKAAPVPPPLLLPPPLLSRLLHTSQLKLLFAGARLEVQLFMLFAF